MSPNFLFRLDLEASAGASRLRPQSGCGPSRSDAAAASQRPSADSSGVQPLSDYALASRLSYFLWSSMPDEELLAHAAAGDLHRPEVLAAQAHRMLQDPRVRALALEFGGNWLDFRRFEEHNAVDRNRFPSFNDNLREAMFEEPLHFLMDTFQNDRSVLDMLYGKHTFVNAALARHYGMTDVKATGNEWVRVDNADRYGRGGLLPMAVFLTQNSPGLRTSPVKRGYWVVKRVLGEYIPPPPATVPALPERREQDGRPDAAPGAGGAPREPGLRRLPCAVRLLRPGLRRVRADRRAAQQGPRRKTGRRAARPSPAAPSAPGSRACRHSSASSARRIFLTPLAANCCPTD